MLATMMNGKVVHEEVVAWGPPGDGLKIDFCGIGPDE